MNKYVYILKIITLICALSVTSTYAQVVDFGAFSRGAEEARRQNQADEDYANRRRQSDYERSIREQENERRKNNEANQKRQYEYEQSLRDQEIERRRTSEENRLNLINQYRNKYKETNDHRYAFLASEIGDTQATSFLIRSGVFCSKNVGVITCTK